VPEPLDLERALLLLALLTLVPAALGVSFVIGYRGWQPRRAHRVAAFAWILAMAVVAPRLLG
jgi:hypothetical protein